MNTHEAEALLSTYINELLAVQTSETDYTPYINGFYAIYSDGKFRHSYAQIANVIYQNLDKGEDLLDYLCQTLGLVLKGIELKQQELQIKADCIDADIDDIREHEGWLHTSQAFRKLLDHIKLQVTNIKYSGKSELNDLERKIRTVSSSNQQLIEHHTEQKTLIEKLGEKIENFNAQSITVLGIFAGIVMAFTGAFSLLGSAFSQINAVSFYRLLFLVLLVGFVLINSIFILIYMVGKLVNKSVASNCKYSTPSPAVSSVNFRNRCECDPEQRRKCNPLKRFYRRYPFVSILDAVILCMIALLAIMRFIWK